MGEKGREVYYTFTFTDDTEAMGFDTVLQRFDAYFAPKKNISYLQCRFFSCNQLQGQNIDDFVTELKSRAAHREFQTLKDSLIKDKLVIGINDKKVLERLLREKDLDLEKAIQICRADEEVKEQSHEINNGASSSKSSIQVDKISSRKRNSRKANKIELRSQQDQTRIVNQITSPDANTAVCHINMEDVLHTTKSARIVIREII